MSGKKQGKGMKPALLILLCAVIAAAAVLGTGYFYYKEKFNGSSVAYSRQAVRDMKEGSLDYTMAKMFYSEDEIQSIRNDSKDEPVSDTSAQEDVLDTKGIRIDRVYGSTFQGYMMLVKDPSDVSIAISPTLTSGSSAPSLDEYVELYNAAAAINAGGFEDAGGKGNGGNAWGIVISNGKLVSGSLSTYSSVIGIDANNKLICADTTAETALSWGIRDAVTFGPVFINNYEVTYQSGDGDLPNLNPRTAIGQREDGTFLLLVIDGRGPSSFGALYSDIVKVFQDYDAQTAANLDGGNSSAMIYNGSYVNDTVSMYGSRSLPSVFLVKGGN